MLFLSKRNLLPTLAVAIVMSAAAFSSSGCSGNTETEGFVVDSVVIDRSWTLPEPQENDPFQGVSHFVAKVDYPIVDSNDAEHFVADSVKYWISKMLLPDEAPMLRRSVVEAAANSFFGGVDGNEWGANRSVSIHKILDTNEFVSFEFTSYTYAGTKHGSCYLKGATFFKEDGHRVSWNDFRTSNQLRKKVTNAIRSMRNDMDDNALLAVLVGDEDNYLAPDGSISLPLPKSEPWLTKQGWSFAYQPSEILPIEFGVPSCIIAANDLPLK